MTSRRASFREKLLPTLADLWDAFLSFVATAVGLGAAIALVSGVSARNAWAVLAAAGLVSLLTWLLSAPMRLLADRFGAVVAFVLGLAVQFATLWISLSYLPGMVVDRWSSAVWVILIAGAVIAATAWLLGDANSNYVIGPMVRRGRRQRTFRRQAAQRGQPLTDEREPGLLVFVMDGVAEPVLRTAIEAGMAPTITRWLRDGSHRLEHWWAQVPSTTPASFAGLLHGKADHIPAFRWWDPSLGRLVVANHPWDATAIESDMSDGEGLCAHDGAAIGTIFSGDAPHTGMVMSRTVGYLGARTNVGGAYVRFFASPLVFSRNLVLTIGEMIKEIYQARMAQLRGVHPRISRGGWYILLRGITNVTMRGLSTSLVAQHMERGTPTIVVDFVDYDEIAHHAGPLRPESLRALEGLDGVLETFETAAEVAARNYRIVVVSDHGQALGSTFEQLAGCSLDDFITLLMGGKLDSTRTISGGEEWGPVNALINDLISRRNPKVRGPERTASPHDPVELGTPDVAVTTDSTSSREASAKVSTDPRASDAVAVIASGNLSLVWFTGLEGRTRLGEVQERWPNLIAGLASHPAIGVVVVESERGLVAIGPRGTRDLEPASDVEPVQGEDPLAAFPDPDATQRDLVRAGRLRHTGDLLIVSSVNDGHIHAFEHQVGSHGGIGGDQNQAMFLTPTSLSRDGHPEELVGADAVYRQLVDWQRELGLRPAAETRRSR